MVEALEQPEQTEQQNNGHRFDEALETMLTTIVTRDEYSIAKSNHTYDMADFDAAIDMLECNRTEKDYDWKSDVFIPDFASIILTDASNFASQYFQSHDFVEVYMSSGEPQAKQRAEAAKELINATLNRKDLYHYQKYIRARLINSLGSYVWLKCCWEQKIEKKLAGMEKEPVQLDVDDYGNQIIDPSIQKPAVAFIDRPVYKDDIIYDRFNYEVFDPRNVFSSDEYAYTAQQKRFVIFRSEQTYEELLADQERCGYFNLQYVKELSPPSETDTSKESYNKDPQAQKSPKKFDNPFDVLERFGKMWVIVTERKQDGYPVACEPGLDMFGEIKEGAEFIECVMTIVVNGSSKVLIGFKPQPYRDGRGIAYRPIIRGLCYIHPTKDTGLGDGKYGRELQKAINDTFNISNDRVMLATLPTLIGRKYSIQDNTTLYFEPQHIMEVDDPVNDLKELNIRDNIQGSLQQGATLTNKLQQVLSVYPTTMGDIPSIASTTATAIAGAESRSNTRQNYKSLTIEYTMLHEFYYIIMQMTYQYARPETAMRMMPEYWRHFDPNADYTFTPLSQSIEQEYTKMKKIQMWDQVLGRVVAIPHPDTPKMVNYIIGQIATLMGKEFSEFGKMLLNPNIPTAGSIPPEMMGQGGPGGPQPGGQMAMTAPVGQNAGAMGGGPQNQFGGNMSVMEAAARSRDQMGMVQ